MTTKATAISRKGAETRERILDTAQDMILERGFSAMSIDKLIEALGVTKGAFFHHFKSKRELAADLIKRFAESDVQMLLDRLALADKLSDDPLQQVLISVGLLIDEFDKLTEPYPGCLLASYTYELQLFDDEIRNTINANFLTWRRELMARFEKVSKVYPPVIEVDFPSLADELIVIIEGAFILAKSLNDPKIVVKQLQHYKHYLELVFAQSA